MSEMNKKTGATFVFSTHDQMVMDQAGRLIHLKDGGIASDKSME
jgi:putative ABC transport system ATP-binding protein